MTTNNNWGTNDMDHNTSSSSRKTRKRDDGAKDDERNQLVSSINRMAEADIQRVGVENLRAIADGKRAAAEADRAAAEAERACTSGIVARTSGLANLTNSQIQNEEAISKWTLPSFDDDDPQKKAFYLSMADKAQCRYDFITAEMKKLSDTSTSTNTNTNTNTNT
eukprot:CAMPEP_0170804970 /NCGR_PEP_ID=MMETSP0733-20121128/31080_1 /TAXON_ID=186038 /ORGANISM="Fragilariopsis kerguelensis, Strain L26-C5" /LENGTH=164 /DNA_ID=CAMNT_0011159239 /DNA_START=61 /DNA_END=555 /DNA_ORIENTATION=+